MWLPVTDVNVISKIISNFCIGSIYELDCCAGVGVFCPLSWRGAL